MADEHEYPGLEVVARQAIEAAERTLPREVRVGILLAAHEGPHEGGLAWVAGVTRESAVALVCEWLAHQVRDCGQGPLIERAFGHFLSGQRRATFDPHGPAVP